MDVKNFIEKLDTIHAESVRNREENKENIQSSADIICNELDMYESFIPDFFSKNGDADNIRYIYGVLREGVSDDITIPCMDIDRASSIYKEYNDGMMEFVTEIIHSYNSNGNFVTESTEYETKLNRAKECDKVFIESIFGGDNNKPVENNLSEAATNIEYLIDFIPRIQTLKDECTTVAESVDAGDRDKSVLVNQSIQLLYESVSGYCYESIKNIINTYGLIDDKIKAPAESSKKRSGGYQLF